MLDFFHSICQNKNTLKSIFFFLKEQNKENEADTQRSMQFKSGTRQQKILSEPASVREPKEPHTPKQEATTTNAANVTTTVTARRSDPQSKKLLTGPVEPIYMWAFFFILKLKLLILLIWI
jgi:hypothetical protein